jgi:cytochrome c553
MSLYLKKHPWLVWLTFVVLASGLSMAIVLAQKATTAASPEPLANVKPSGPHPVIIKPGPATPRLDTGLKDKAGNAVTVACNTCHASTTPDVQRNTSIDLFQAHRGLQYQHGAVTCLSCHNASNYDTLHLADGRSVAFPDVMTLCSQCHGTARRDYDHGSHGGMNGHWDLTKGGRIRNNCINCHDPHHPEFPLVQPVLPPRDRISVPKAEGSH